MFAVFFHGFSDDLLLKILKTQHEADDLKEELVTFYDDWCAKCEEKQGDRKHLPHWDKPPQHPLVAQALKAWGRDFGGSVCGISVVPLRDDGSPCGYQYVSIDY